MERTFTKAQLLTMNKNPLYGYNWIMNIENIGETKQAILYPTGSALISGRLYVALPSTHLLTQADKNKWNIF